MRPYCKSTLNFYRCFQVATITVLSVFVCPHGVTQPTAASASEQTGRIVVRVRDRISEELLPQVLVQLIHFPGGIVGEQFTGSDGSVQFSGLSVDTFTIRAALRDYEPSDARVDVSDGNQTVQNVNIFLSPRERGRNSAPGGVVAADALKIPHNAQKEFERAKRLLNEKKDLIRSIAALQRAIELYPGYADAYFLLGSAQIQINANSAAEESLKKAIALNAHLKAAYYSLAVLLFGERRYSEEKDLLFEAEELDGTDWHWPFELARCYAQQGQWDIALRYGLTASARSDVPPRIHLLLADVYANSNKSRDAVGELELFTELDPKSAYIDRVREVLPILRQRATASSLPSSEPHR